MNDIRLKKEIADWHKMTNESLVEYSQTRQIDSQIAFKVINKAQILLIRANDQL